MLNGACKVLKSDNAQRSIVVLDLTSELLVAHCEPLSCTFPPPRMKIRMTGEIRCVDTKDIFGRKTEGHVGAQECMDVLVCSIGLLL